MLQQIRGAHRPHHHNFSASICFGAMNFAGTIARVSGGKYLEMANRVEVKTALVQGREKDGLVVNSYENLKKPADGAF